MEALRAGLLAVSAYRQKVIDIDGAKVIVRELGMTVFEQYWALIGEGKRSAAMLLLIKSSVIDETGKRILSEQDAELVIENSRVATKLVTAVMEISGLGEEGQEEAVEKKSDAS